jgi:hypothetical protein
VNVADDNRAPTQCSPPPPASRCIRMPSVPELSVGNNYAERPRRTALEGTLGPDGV